MPIDIEHPSLIIPENSEIVYRYMGLDKFQKLLSENALFFCRADKFSDPFEGSTPRIEAIYRFLKEKRSGSGLTHHQQIKKHLDIGQLHKKFKRSFIVNCWHINKGESDAMWRLYLKTNEGVAIQSTVKRIIEAYTNNHERIYMSKVRYMDYEKEAYFHQTEYRQKSYNLLTPIVHKRKAFAHESELRLFQQIQGAVDQENYWEQTENHLGRNLQCDLHSLIEKVIIPPTADHIVEDKVKQLLSTYQLSCQVEQSKLNGIPI